MIIFKFLLEGKFHLKEYLHAAIMLLAKFGDEFSCAWFVHRVDISLANGHCEMEECDIDAGLLGAEGRIHDDEINGFDAFINSKFTFGDVS